MTFIPKPRVGYPGQPRNALGLTKEDYEGSLSTLCAGCGHDSITAAIVQAFFEMAIDPTGVIKMSGIGCSSKTPAYFLSGAHGFNSVHGRMPAVATGALAANRDLVCIGVSGDGDALSIGFGQFAHAIRRNIDMLYLIENNGVYGLTKGQFSASADPGSKAKRGEINRQQAIDPVAVAITLGCGFVARGFSGDKEQLVPLLKAGLAHRGLALIDIISPCVTFNDHEGSTKSYAHTRSHYRPAIFADFVPPADEILTTQSPGEGRRVVLHDGSSIVLRRIEADFDPADRSGVLARLDASRAKGEVLTGLLYLNEELPEMHDVAGTCRTPLTALDYAALNPGSEALAEIQRNMR